MDDSTTKRCTRCGVDKPRDQFSSGPRYRDGLQSYCKACMRAYRAERYDTPEKVRAERDRTRDYYRDNKEARERNRAAGRERDKYKWHNDPEYRDRKNKQKSALIANDPRWRNNRRTWMRLFQIKRRAIKRALNESFTRQEWDALCAKYDHRCLCCGATGPLHADHIVPLSRGGGNTIENIQPLCGTCNRRKATKAIDYRPDRGG